MSVERNWKITQGDSFTLQIAYSDNNGNPINLLGSSVLFMVRDKPGGQVFCASAGLGDGITFTSASGGIIDINIAPSKTRKFNLPKSAYQIQLTSAGGINTTLLQGYFDVNAGVIE